MKQVLFFSSQFWVLSLLNRFIMLKNSDKVYYAVVRGRETGIYNTWKDCKVQVDGISDAKFRKFFSLEEAEEFVNFWKDYPSSKQKVSRQAHYNGSDRFGLPSRKEDARERKCARSLSKKNSFVLGENGTHDIRSDSPKVFSVPYISPIHGFTQVIASVSERPVTNDSPRPIKTENVEEHRITDVNHIKVEADILEQVSCEAQGNALINNELCLNDSNRTNLPQTSIINPEITTVTSSLPVTMSHTNNTKSCDSTRLAEKEHSNENGMVNLNETATNKSSDCGQSCHKQVLDLKNITITCGEDSSRSGLGVVERDDKVKKLAELLRSALQLIPSESFKNSEDVANVLQLLVKELLTHTSVNPQINPEEVETEEVQSSPNDKADTPENLSACLDQKCKDEQPPFPSPHKCPLSPSVHTSAFDSRTEQKNADVLALNLRLDSFEKRFDGCLKEVGGILSELSHIKSEIKEIKEAVSSLKSCSNSPAKRGGSVQTTLNLTGSKFDSDNFSSSKLSSSPSRLYSSSINADFCEPVVKKAKSLKRKLSSGDAHSSSVTDSCDSDGFDFCKIKTEAVDYTSFTVDSEDFVHVYTDGACHSNGKKGAKAGIGIWFGDCHPLNIAEPVDGSATNNSAEIQAARVAIELAVKAGIKKLKIHTDSEFLLNCATKWIHRWKTNNWTLVDGGKVKNRIELEKLDALASKIQVRWEKVEAHVGIKGNEMADRLANEGARKSTVYSPFNKK